MSRLKVEPVKVCGDCQLEVHSSDAECPLCGYKFEEEDTNQADDETFEVLKSNK